MVRPLTVYKASAGSGKTFTLATEYISLLVENPMSYRTILAVTFTNKATEEMKMRILSQLYGIWKQLPDSDNYLKVVQKKTGLDTKVISERAGISLSNLLNNYNYFRVETIDTFFQSVMRNMARELDLTTNLRIGLNDVQVEELAVDQLIADLSTTDAMPYTLVEVHAGSVYAGLYSIVATVKDDEHLQALKEEIDGIANRLTQSKDELLNNFYFGEGVKKKLVLTKGLETHPMHVLRTENRDNVFGVVTGWQLVMHYAGILFVLLFVPALNLCGIVAGRMERRSAEIAVRKTFGARRSTLLNQVVMENLVLTTIGGIIGLVFSWLAIYGLRREILGMFFDNSTLNTAPIVEGEMLFAPSLFIGAFGAILVLNLLAAVIPAWWSLRKPIVESMMEKR